MSTQPSVVVNKKGGFFTAIAQGFFGFLIVTIVCATLLGMYGLWVADKKTDVALDLVARLTGDSADMAKSVLQELRNWREIAPPLIADAFNDRRDPTYRDQLDFSTSIAPYGEDSDRYCVIVEVANNGAETVSLLTARISVSNPGAAPDREIVAAVATPLAFEVDHELFRGPLLPGSVRRFVVDNGYGFGRGRELSREARVTHEITELRLWVEPDTDLAFNDTADPILPPGKTE